MINHTEKYIEVNINYYYIKYYQLIIQSIVSFLWIYIIIWNYNVICHLVSVSMGRVSYCVIVIWVFMQWTLRCWNWRTAQPLPVWLMVLDLLPDTNSSLHHIIKVSKGSPVIRRLFLHRKMVIINCFLFEKQCFFWFCFWWHLPYYPTIVAPSAPPHNIRIGMYNLTAGWVRWSPPPQHHHNGNLLGYKIEVKYMKRTKMKIKYSK